MVNIIVTGANGRMGKTLMKLISDDPELKLAGAVDISDNLNDVIDGGDVVIDFSLPSATPELLRVACGAKKPMIIGTTGHRDKESFKKASKDIPLLVSPNMSVGVNLLWKLTELATKTLGKTYNVSLKETHHVHKKDAPSGTAKRLVEIVSGITETKDIPVESIREGEVVGRHVITFSAEGDQIKIVHNAFTREIFASGALRAAKWIVDKPAGLYDMQDVLF